MVPYLAQILFVTVFGTIVFYGWQNKYEEPTDPDEQYAAFVRNTKAALVAIFFVYISHRVFDPNIRQLFKPFETVWRANYNIISVYLYILVFVYMMNINDARGMWKFVESRLGKRITKDYHTYDDNCELEIANFLDNMDHYFLAHFTNWFLAAVILRDAPLLHFWSVLDEILEFSAQYKLPHFRE